MAKAAELQGEETAERVLRRLRESVFVLGEPADTLPLALSVVRGVPGLDPVRLASDAASDEVRERVRADAAETRRPLPEAWAEPGASPHPGTAKETPDGGHRYALPTLLLRSGDARRLVPGWRELGEYTAAAEELCPGVLDAAPAPPSPAAALSRYGSLTDPERHAPGGGRLAPAGGGPGDDGERAGVAVPRGGPQSSSRGPHGRRPCCEPRLTSGGVPSHRMRHQKVSIDFGCHRRQDAPMLTTHPGVVCRYVDLRRTSSALCR